MNICNSLEILCLLYIVVNLKDNWNEGLHNTMYIKPHTNVSWAAVSHPVAYFLRKNVLGNFYEIPIFKNFF